MRVGSGRAKREPVAGVERKRRSERLDRQFVVFFGGAEKERKQFAKEGVARGWQGLEVQAHFLPV